MQTAIASGVTNRTAESIWGITNRQADWFADYLPADDQAGPVLSLAAGDGRSARVALAQGHKVFVVDRNVDEIMDLATGGNAVIMRADVVDSPWPFPADYFSSVLISRPLPRHTVEAAAASIQPGGTLIFDLDADPFEAALPERPTPPGLIARWLADRFEIVTDREPLAGRHSFDFGPRLVARKRSAPLRFEQVAGPAIRRATR